jgi:hypothetical protein
MEESQGHRGTHRGSTIAEAMSNSVTHTSRLAREVDQKLLQTFNRDGSNGEPYANHLDGPLPESFPVIPVLQRDDAQAAGSVGGLKRRRLRTGTESFISRSDNRD